MRSFRNLQLRLPRPRTFLAMMSLKTGTEMIALATLFNKLTGLYGILAILTGYHISLTQLSMYIYSIVALITTAYCLPHIRKQNPFKCLAFAWLYIIDMLVNTLYTAFFAVSWYLANAEDEEMNLVPEITRLSSAVDDTSSTVFIVVFSLLRVYFVLVVMAYARSVLPQNMEGRREGWSDVNGLIAYPFARDSSEGQGWTGELGRMMTSVGHSYWLASEKSTNMGANYHRVKLSAV